MKPGKLIIAVVVMILVASQAYAITITFDDIPGGYDFWYQYYGDTYGINVRSFDLASHTESDWWTPKSGTHVAKGNSWGPGIDLKKAPADGGPAVILYASSMDGYFSTEPGVVLYMLGYHLTMDNPVTPPIQIGLSDQAWDNVHVQIASSEGMSSIAFIPVTTDALQHFCVDDLTVNFVPEPSSLLALIGCLAGIGGIAWRRRR